MGEGTVGNLRGILAGVAVVTEGASVAAADQPRLVVNAGDEPGAVGGVWVTGVRVELGAGTGHFVGTAEAHDCFGVTPVNEVGPVAAVSGVIVGKTWLAVGQVGVAPFALEVLHAAAAGENAPLPGTVGGWDGSRFDSGARRTPVVVAEVEDATVRIEQESVGTDLFGDGAVLAAGVAVTGGWVRPRQQTRVRAVAGIRHVLGLHHQNWSEGAGQDGKDSSSAHEAVHHLLHFLFCAVLVP